MRHYVFILIGIISLNCFSQEQSSVIKLDVSGITEYNLYQFSYEFNIKERNSLEISAGYGQESNVNIFTLGVQPRYYLLKSKSAPEGLHVGPRVIAAYAKSAQRDDYTRVFETAFGFEIDGILGYQFFLGNTLTLDPYLGTGLAIINNETTPGLIWGITIGFKL